eukprot:ANDGO_06789.mRNA.1 hypothetical protein
MAEAELRSNPSNPDTVQLRLSTKSDSSTANRSSVAATSTAIPTGTTTTTATTASASRAVNPRNLFAPLYGSHAWDRVLFVLNWRSVPVSAAAFTSCLTVGLLLRYSLQWNVLSLAFFAAFLGSLILFALQLSGSFMQSGSRFSGFKQGMSQQLDDIVDIDRLSKQIASAIREWLYLFSSTHPLLWALIFWISYKITCMFFPATLFIIDVILAFGVPVFYAKFEKEVNKIVSQIKDVVSRLWATVYVALQDLLARIPRASALQSANNIKQD